jgi:hypothetical protein
MILQNAFNQMVRDALQPMLKTAGFAKKGLNFYRRRTATVEVINLQRSCWNSVERLEFFVNIGSYVPALDAAWGEPILEFPKEYECHFRRRLEALAPFGCDRFGFSSPAEAIEIQPKLRAALAEALAFLEKMDSLDGFLTVAVQMNGLLNFDKILTFMVQTHRHTLAEVYVKNLESLLTDDDRWPQFHRQFEAILNSADGLAP